MRQTDSTLVHFQILFIFTTFTFATIQAQNTRKGFLAIFKSTCDSFLCQISTFVVIFDISVFQQCIIYISYILYINVYTYKSDVIALSCTDSTNHREAYRRVTV